MKFRAIIMAPSVVEFESEADNTGVSNQAWALCNNFPCVRTPEDTFVPRLLLVIPKKELAPAPLLVFDPPPMAA